MMLSEARMLQTGHLFLTDVMIVSILSMLPAEPYYSITMDTSQPRTWIAHDRLFEYTAHLYTSATMEDPEIPNNLCA